VLPSTPETAVDASTARPARPVGIGVANALSSMRMLLAVAMPWLLRQGGPLPLVAWGLAALSDYLDGPLARRRNEVSAVGAILDNVADVTFVLGGLTAAAALGMVPWLVPGSIALSAGAYAAASARPRPRAAVLARSQLGHWAGVLNYVCLGLVTGSVALPDGRWATVLTIAGAATAGLNLAAVGSRLAAAVRRAVSRAR
jgi:CDP-diacylglycerol---glycerol-3-phosphate 3-phosphatidyltransferase